MTFSMIFERKERLDTGRTFFWHVRFNEQSRLLTTMITPFGRCHLARLPFGLSVSSEISQKCLTEAPDGLKGVICIMDDTVMVGHGDTPTEAEKDRDENLYGLKNSCKERNIRLNDAQATIHLEEVTFMGHRISPEEVQPDQARLQ